jgi:hypothetical protein
MRILIMAAGTGVIAGVVSAILQAANPWRVHAGRCRGSRRGGRRLRHASGACGLGRALLGEHMFDCHHLTSPRQCR